MIELALIAAVGAPHYFANEYCWARYRGETHEQAELIARELTGTEPDDYAWSLTKGTDNWCPNEETNEETN